MTKLAIKILQGNVVRQTVQGGYLYIVLLQISCS